MNRRGTALLAAIWFLALASGLAFTTLAHGRDGLRVTENRLALVRGRWAVDACLSVMRAEFEEDQRIERLDSVDLGDGIWCSALPEDAGRALNINHADIRALRLLFGSEQVAAGVADWIDSDDNARTQGAERAWYMEVGRPGPRNAPISDLRELLSVRGVSDSTLARAGPFLTTRGTGRVQVNAASAEVLRLLPGMSDEYAHEVVRRRERGSRIAGIDDLIGRASGRTRESLADSYAELIAMTSYQPEFYLLHVTGVGGSTSVTATVSVVPVGDRLAVVGKEAW
jgi:type II secretory pathway component PulK